MSRAACFLLALLLGLVGLAAGYYFGHGQGVFTESAKRDGQAVKDLAQMLDAHKDLVSQAGVASKQMRRAVAQRAAQDAHTTQELKNALATTADSRANCVFPPDVMRQLAEARDKAGQAAALGIRGAVPGASAPAKPTGR